MATKRVYKDKPKFNIEFLEKRPIQRFDIAMNHGIKKLIEKIKQYGQNNNR